MGRAAQVGHRATWPLFHSTAQSREAEGGYSLLNILIQLPPKNIFEINPADAEARHCTVDAPQHEKKKLPYCKSMNTLENYDHHCFSCQEKGFGLIRVTSAFDTCRLQLPKIYGSDFICLQTLTS